MASIKALSLAAELAANLERRTRDNGNEFVCLADNSPEWMFDVVHAAHGESMPNDTIYKMIERNANALAEVEEDDAEDARDAVMDIEPPIYNAELTGWLAADLDHIWHCEEALNEYGPSNNLLGILANGWKHQQETIAYLLLDALEAEAQKREEETA